MMRFGTGLLALLLIAASPAALQAQDAPPLTISASQPGEMLSALRFAGYEAELVTDSVGDPMIETEFAGYIGSIMFYGCDEQTNQGCDAVQLRVGLDRAEPMSLEMINDSFGNDRFYGVHLDDEGDPWFNWDIVTGRGEGIPTSVFLLAVKEFATQVGAASAVVFAEEREKSINLGNPAPREPETT